MSGLERKDCSSLTKRSNHMRKLSSSTFSVEELTPDDMGYDADVEIVRPDTYEEADSESEDAPTPLRPWQNTDEELVTRMKQLGREQMSALPSHGDRGRKRRSFERTPDDSMLGVPLSPGFDVQEIVDATTQPSPAKRRRKKSRRPNAAQHLLRSHDETCTDSSDKRDGNVGVPGHRSTPSTPSDQMVGQRDVDDVMMDV